MLATFTSFSRVALIANPRAGAFRGKRAAEAAAEVFADAGHAVEVQLTERAGHAGELANEAATRFDLILAVGGDGTLAEVLIGLASHAAAPVTGIIPVGTANVVAREIGLPLKSPKRAAEALATGKVVLIDQGLANGRPFVANVGAGFDARVVHALTAARARKRGRTGMLGYLPIGLGELKRFEAPRLFVVTEDGERLGAFSAVTVCNTANYGGIMSLTPKATMTDGRLDLYARRGTGRRSTFRQLACGLLRCEDSQKVTYRSGTRFRIECEGAAEPLQIDGDPAGLLPAEISLIPKGLRFLVPSRFSVREP
ncbi:MAG: diacylglycerol kinase family lipid kinase [Planctomycetes bacterium]|nr:diacylglycerol kinase family lipid kinase [Planctomycetota bacterium]